MPKFPQPWERKGRGWYVTLDGQQIPLGKDWDTAEEMYLELRREKPKPLVSDAFAVFADQFLTSLQANKKRSKETYEWYRCRLQQFLDRYPGLRIRDMEHHHLQDWIDPKDVSSGTKRNCG